jgi:hypothetical protein
MENKLEGAMEQLKILDLDFGRKSTNRRMLVMEAISKMKDKMVGSDREEFDQMIRGTRV